MGKQTSHLSKPHHMPWTKRCQNYARRLTKAFASGNKIYKSTFHDDVMERKHFRHCWPFLNGILWLPGSFPSERNSNVVVWCFPCYQPLLNIQVSGDFGVLYVHVTSAWCKKYSDRPSATKLVERFYNKYCAGLQYRATVLGQGVSRQCKPRCSNLWQQTALFQYVFWQDVNRAVVQDILELCWTSQAHEMSKYPVRHYERCHFVRAKIILTSWTAADPSKQCI